MKIGLIGDSIRIGWEPYVKADAAIHDNTVTFYSGSNNQNSSSIVSLLSTIRAENCTHWVLNSGLWDVKREPNPDSAQVISDATYQSNWETIFQAGVDDGVAMIFLLTTPVDESKFPGGGTFYRFNDDIEAKNTIINNIANTYNVTVIDLYSRVGDLGLTPADGTHYNIGADNTQYSMIISPLISTLHSVYGGGSIMGTPKKYGKSKYWKQYTLKSENVYETDENIVYKISEYGFADYDKVSDSGGLDIVFTDKAGNLLDRQIVLYDSDNQKIEIYVKIPEIDSATDTHIYMQFGGDNVANTTDVWSENYLASYPFQGNANDYSSSGDNGTVSGPEYASSGIINGNYDFVRANNDLITLSNDTLYQNLSGVTVMALIKPDDVSAVHGIFTKRHNGAGRGFSINVYYGQFEARWIRADQGASEQLFSGADTIAADTVHHVAFTHDGTTGKIFVNGILKDSGAVTLESAQQIAPYIGRTFLDTSNNYFDGEIDELQTASYAIPEATIRSISDNLLNYSTNGVFEIGNTQLFTDDDKGVFKSKAYNKKAFRKKAFRRRAFR